MCESIISKETFADLVSVFFSSKRESDYEGKQENFSHEWGWRF